MEAPNSLARFSPAAMMHQLQTISGVRLNPTAASISSPTLMVGARPLDQSSTGSGLLNDVFFWPVLLNGWKGRLVYTLKNSHSLAKRIITQLNDLQIAL